MISLRVLLVDDSLEFIESATHLITNLPQIEIVGRTHSAQDALDLMTLIHPDLVFMDIAMSGMNGLTATAKIKSQTNAPWVVILTLHDDAEYRAAAQAAGADGFVSKTELGDKLPALISRLMAERFAPDYHASPHPENE